MKKQAIFLLLISFLLMSFSNSVLADGIAEENTDRLEKSFEALDMSYINHNSMTIASYSTIPTPPPEPQCPSGALLLQQDIIIDEYGIVTQSIVRFVGDGSPGSITQFTVPILLPAEFDGPVEITIPDAVAWDGYLTRVNDFQPNERFRMVFLKNNVPVWTSDWTGDLADNVVSAFWQGPIGGPVILPDGADQLILAHWGDLEYGTGDQSNPNSVTPSSICIDYKTVVSSIGDTVWQDNNGNGIQDAGEPGIPNVTVDLRCAGPDAHFGTADDIIASDITDSNGNYLFTDLPAGVCQVNPDQTTVPDGYELTTNNDPLNVNLGLGEDYLDADFGYQLRQLTLGNHVWYDQDQDGIQDANEPGYNGATVDLYNNASCSGTPIASTTTMAGPAGFGGGYYQFSGLLAGDYCVQFGNIPAGWSISPANQGADDTVDSDATGSAQIPNISLTGNDPDEDMGIYVTGSLGDSVICTSTGAGLANITISLFEDFDGNGVADGPSIATTETDANGFYQFIGLEVALAGDPNNTTAYIVQVDVTDADLGTCNVPVLPTEYNPPLDSDNPNDPDNDFSFEEQPATVGDRVWFDNDGDGVQDAGEPGIPDVTVNLTDCAGSILATDVTDANGSYLFDGLAAGTYCVVIDKTTLPDDVVQTFEKDGSLDGDTQQPLNAGDDIRDVDFGYVVVAIAIEKYTRVEVSQTGGDLCGTYDKTQLLTMLYTGDNINDNSQDPSKVTITGDPQFAQTVRILATNKNNPNDTSARVWFNSVVNLGEQFTLDATNAGQTNFDSETYVYIFDLNGNLLQSIRFHTSCSQPLLLGDQFGGIQLVGFVDKVGNGESLPQTTGFGDDADTPTGPTAVVGDTIVWTYIVTNAGSAPLSNVSVTDDAGTPADTSDDFAPVPVENGGVNVGDVNSNGFLDVGEEWQFTASGTARLGQYGNMAVVTGSAAGVTVIDDDPSHYFGEYTGADLCETYGRPQILTMLYTGDNVNDNLQDPSKVVITGDPMFADPVLIIASEKENGGGKVYFNGQVNLGETFVIDAKLAGDSELRSETWVTIYDLNGNVLQSIKFHTSCSQPLAIDDQFGSIQLFGFADKNGNGP